MRDLDAIGFVALHRKKLQPYMVEAILTTMRRKGITKVVNIGTLDLMKYCPNVAKFKNVTLVDPNPSRVLFNSLCEYKGRPLCLIHQP